MLPQRCCAASGCPVKADWSSPGRPSCRLPSAAALGGSCESGGRGPPQHCDRFATGLTSWCHFRDRLWDDHRDRDRSAVPLRDG